MEIKKIKLGALIALGLSLSLPPLHAQPARRTEGARSAAVERARHAVVVIERKGQPIALGFVLANDGRVLTARSPLGEQRAVELRFSNGARRRAHLDHEDGKWDLALLRPEPFDTGKAGRGLIASEANENHGRFAAFTGLSTQRLQPIWVALRGRTTFLGKAAPRNDALELASALGPQDLGTPILDEAGAVVAVVTRGCLLVEGGRSEACLPVPVGAPVPVVRQFLSKAPLRAPKTPWLGARVVADATPYARGVRIQDVEPRSPASSARLRGGSKEEADLVVAIDGSPVPTAEALSQAIRGRAVGDLVTLLVFGRGEFREVPIVLEAAPEAFVKE